MVQWLRIHLPMQGSQFDPLSVKIPTRLEATKPCAPEPVLCSERGHCSDKPAHRGQRVAPGPARHNYRKPGTAPKKFIFFKKENFTQKESTNIY